MPLNCTFEVTQRFLYIIVTLLHKINEFGVKGVSGWLDLSLSLPERWHGVEMRVLARISSILLFPDRFRVKPYPSKQKKGVEGLPLKDLVRGPVCWAKMVHSGNPGNKLSGHHLSVWSPSICSQGMPCQVLLSGMLGLGRGGQRQLKFSKAMDSNFTVSPFEFAAVFQNMPLTTFTSYKLKTSHANRLPKPCTQ